MLEKPEHGGGELVGRVGRENVSARFGVDAAGRHGLATTGTPIAIDSRILFCVPRAMISGATVNARPCTSGRTSGTVPVTEYHSRAESRDRARRRGPDDLNNARGRWPDQRQNLAAEPRHGLLIREIVHPANEADWSGS